MLFNVLKGLIAQNRTAGLAEKIDVFYAADKLTQEQYTELVSLLSGEESE